MCKSDDDVKIELACVRPPSSSSLSLSLSLSYSE